MKTIQGLWISLLATFGTAAVRFPTPITTMYPGAIVNAPSIAQFVSPESGFDEPKVSPVNITATDVRILVVLSQTEEYPSSNHNLIIQQC